MMPTSIVTILRITLFLSLMSKQFLVSALTSMHLMTLNHLILCLAQNGPSFIESFLCSCYQRMEAITYMDTLILYCLIQMTHLSLPNLMMRYMVDSVNSTRGASMPYAMFLTSILKYFSVELEEEEVVKVTSMIEERQVKPQASPKKSAKQATTRAKGKYPFVELSDDEDDPKFVIEKLFRRRARRRTFTTKKLKLLCHMLR